MSDQETPAGSPPAKAPVDDSMPIDEVPIDQTPVDESAPVNDGQEREFQDELAAADSDRDSDALSEVDENQFEDYDPETVNIADRPQDIDEETAWTLKATKRKRAEGDARKPREGRREKKRRDRDEDVDMDDDDEDSGKKARRARRAADGERRPRKKTAAPEPVNEEHLSPEERRKLAIDRALDAAIKKPGGTKRRKKDEIDLEDEIDEQLSELKIRMERACRADNDALKTGQPGLHKLKLLPEVISVLNRTNIQHAVLDPDTNLLMHVKFFLEPLENGTLPAYNIQRDILTALTRLNIEKDSLISSGIGKVVLFYTRSSRAEPSIKRMAESLVREWSLLAGKQTADYKKRRIETREFDYQAAKLAQRQRATSHYNLAERPANSSQDMERERFLAPSRANNAARMPGLPSSYSIAPKSTFDASRVMDHRPLGASGMEAFRKMTQKSKKRS